MLVSSSLLENSPSGSDHRPENHNRRQRDKPKARKDEESLFLLQATRGARNSNLQVVITHAWHVCSQHSFGLPLRINGMHRTHFGHARLDVLSHVI